ncbi:hypothetical protein V495_05304 [Pseudogymnoascus sp. VKM F-4514 (FW-929)]|nr:hypothetical protein V495_05304 [Pseudogymnoascus sp. VKM F-4514 (FW-929)]KFY55334.1 hypothetical protein V497_07073 [Pseudogymnoascus sp. VKM F-4516 (FW-969)]
MPLCQPYPEDVMPELISGPGQHELVEAHENVELHHATAQDTDSEGSSVASYTHISSMIQSLDELLAGEDEALTSKGKPYDVSVTVQAFPTIYRGDQLDPATLENARLEYENYLQEVKEKPTFAPRIERVNDPSYFISKGVITGTKYPVVKSPPETPPRHPRNGYRQNSYVPDHNPNKTLWDTREQRLNAIEHQNVILDPRARLSDYFMWGISYNPPDELSQGYRAVNINAPAGTSLKDILDCIDTGPIYSATLCDTVAITGGLTAYIVFVDESGASQLKSNMANNSLRTIHITSNPTWPISATMLKNIRQGWTRCLSIRGLPLEFSTEDVVHMIVQPGYSQAREVLEVHRIDQSDFRVELSSIPAADKVFRLMSAHYRGSDVAVSFAADPCSPGLPVPFGATPDASPTTLSPASSFGSQDNESIDNKTSLAAKYGPPPAFRHPEPRKQNGVAAPEISCHAGNAQPRNFVASKDAANTSSTRVDVQQYMAAAALMQLHSEDASLLTQQSKADLESPRDFSELVPTFEYSGSGLNWADEMIEEAAEEEYRNAPALGILAQQALSERVY